MNQPIHISLPTPFAIGAVNAYLFGEVDSNGAIDPASNLTLADCGVNTEESWEALVTALARNDISVADIRHVLITHAHVDHMGMAARIVEQSDANVLIWEQIAAWAFDTEAMWQERVRFLTKLLHEIDMAELQRDSILSGMSSSKEFWPNVPKSRVETFSLNDSLSFGGMSWEIVYAPGHSNTQTCFFQPDSGQFIAADMLLPLTPAPVLEHPIDGTAEREPCLPQLLRSYDMVHAMPIRYVYPGHGEPFMEHQPLIKQQQERIVMRKEECLALIRDGNHQVGQLLDIMYSHHPETARFTAVCTLVGYLDLLLADGAIREVVESGKKRYYLA